MIGAINKKKMHVSYWKTVLQEKLVSLISLPFMEVNNSIIPEQINQLPW